MITRQKTADKLAFLQLIFSLIPKEKGGITNDYVRESLTAGFECVYYDSEIEFQIKATELNYVLEKMVDKAKKIFPPKEDIHKIGAEFNNYLKQNKEYFSFGIEYGWLEKFLDCSIVWDDKYPYHARVGTNYHASRISVEEQFLLRDAFYFYVLAENELDKLHKIGTYLKFSPDKNMASKAYPDASIINLNTCSFARTTILQLYSFFETFVNSLSYDFLMQNENSLSESEKEILIGKSKGKFLSLEKKIEKSHQIIRGNEKPTLKTIDRNQLIEPFKTILSEHKELRDSSVHYNPTKEKIWIRPTEWVEKMTKYGKAILDGSRLYWKACSDEDYPFYLDELDFEHLHKITLERIKRTEEIKNNYT